MEESFWDVVVTHWGMARYDLSHPDTLPFRALVNKSQTVKVEDFAQFFVGNVTLDDGSSYEPRCPCPDCTIDTLCSIECENYDLNDLLSEPSLDDQEVYQMSQFWVFLVLMIFGWVGQAISVSVGDAICFQMLGMYNKLCSGIFTFFSGLLTNW